MKFGYVRVSTQEQW